MNFLGEGCFATTDFCMKIDKAEWLGDKDFVQFDSHSAIITEKEATRKIEE